MKSLIIAVDFDGTCVTHEYPQVGLDVGAVPTLKALVDRGDRLILWTMRSGKELDDAVAWFSRNGIVLWGVNDNCTQKNWTSSPKVYANIYIDDAALGAPLIRASDVARPFIDWARVARLLDVKL